jgi:hypothetical protein
MDLQPSEFSILGAVAHRVKETDAWSHGRFDVALREYQQRTKDVSKKETNEFVDERFVDFMHDGQRRQELMTDGRKSTKFFDLAPTGGR